jgi:hypothetical protein
MNLLLLAPDIQEQLLFLSRVEQGRDPIHLRQLQPIAVVSDWRKQRGMWAQLRQVYTAADGEPIDGMNKRKKGQCNAECE